MCTSFASLRALFRSSLRQANRLNLQLVVVGLAVVFCAFSNLRRADAAPIVINTITDLQNIQNNLSGNYVLGNDINASGFNFTPIGGNSPFGNDTFTGSLDGHGHTISNLSINSNTPSINIGLFATGNNMSISNLNLANVDISANGVGVLIGAVAGSVFGGSIVNVTSSGVINLTGFQDSAGGLVGLNRAQILGSSSSVSIVGQEVNVIGGLVADNQGSIFQSHASGTLTNTASPTFAHNSAVGGLAGANEAQITQSYATGVINCGGTNVCGGLIGWNIAGQVTDSYARGAVTGNVAGNLTASLGGLVGENDSGTIIRNAYATGALSGSANSNIGGLVGLNGGTITNGYTADQLTLGVLPSGFNTSVWTVTSGQYPTLIANPQPQNNPAPNDPATLREPAHLANALATPVDPSKPTIILTHGWEFTGTYNPDVSPLGNLTQSVKTALQNPDGTYKANILTFQWQDAFHPDPFRPELATFNAGAVLAQAIADDFGPSYTGSIQLVGHSYGTLVNSFAARDLDGYFTFKTFSIDQLTFLDPPILAPTAWVPSDVYYNILPGGTIQYVDNFWANNLTGGFGAPLFGAAPSGGQLVLETHSGVQNTFYAGRVLDSDLWVTALNEDTYATRPAPAIWSGQTLLQAVVSITTEFAANAWHSIVNTAQEATARIGGKLTSWLHLKESSPVMVARELTIPATATFLTFDFSFANIGDGDWITVNFGDKLIWTFLGTDFLNDLMTATIPIADLAGQEGTLYITLNNTGQRNADVYVGDIAFASFSTASAVPEPSNVWLILIGFIALLVVVRRNVLAPLSLLPVQVKHKYCDGYC